MSYTLESKRDENPPEWKGKLGVSVIPRYTFIMETRHGATDAASVQKKIREKVGEGIPEDVLKRLSAEISTRLGMGGGVHSEYHVLVLAEDKVAGTIEAIEIHGHTTAGDGLHNHGARIMDTEKSENYDVEYASARTTALNIQYRKEWNGERVLPAIEFEAASLAEMDAKMAATPYESVWKTLVPREAVSVAVPEELEPQTPMITEKNRSELVKRFGEKAIRAAERRIKDAQKEVK